MKALIFAAMLSVSGIALAQGQAPMTQEPADAEATPAEPADPAMPDEQASPPEAPMPQQSMPAEPAPSDAMPAPEPMQSQQPMPSQQPMQPSGQTVDDPSQSSGPRGVTQQGTVPDGMAAAPAGEYPACSRTVTDSCTQTYERGRRRPR